MKKAENFAKEPKVPSEGLNVDLDKTKNVEQISPDCTMHEFIKDQEKIDSPTNKPMSSKLESSSKKVISREFSQRDNVNLEARKVADIVLIARRDQRSKREEVEAEIRDVRLKRYLFKSR